MARDLSADTSPVSLGDGRYRTTLGTEWSFREPSGGVLTTAALRAARVELADPGLAVRSSTTIFSSVVVAGELDVTVRTIRRGSATAQVQVNLRNAGSEEPGLDVVATFGRSREGGPTFEDRDRPPVPRPEDCPLLAEPTPIAAGFRPAIFRQIEVRLALGHSWWEEGWPAGPARLARWMRYRTPQLVDGALDPLCLPPMVDTMPPSTIQKLGPGFTPFVAPSLDLTVHYFEPTPTEWFLLDTHTRHAGAGYGSADVHVWDDAGRMVAFATQMWMFRRVPAR